MGEIYENDEQMFGETFELLKITKATSEKAQSTTNKCIIINTLWIGTGALLMVLGFKFDNFALLPLSLGFIAGGITDLVKNIQIKAGLITVISDLEDYMLKIDNTEEHGKTR